jgi:hypothetical protein
MTASGPCVALPSPPTQRPPRSLDAPSEQTPGGDRSDGEPDISPAVMTVAMVGESGDHWDELDPAVRAAEVAARLAGLAVNDELVVVYGADDRDSGPGVQTVVAELRRVLTRHTVVVLFVTPFDGPGRRDTILLDELLELGSLPIVVTPPGAVACVAAELHHRLRADRVLRLVGGPAVPEAEPAYGRAA